MRGAAGLAGVRPPVPPDDGRSTRIKAAVLGLTVVIVQLVLIGYLVLRPDPLPTPPFVHLLKGTFDGCFVDADGTTDILLNAGKVETLRTPETFTDAWCRKQVFRAEAEAFKRDQELAERLKQAAEKEAAAAERWDATGSDGTTWDEPAASSAGKVLRFDSPPNIKQEMINSPGGRQVAGDGP